MSRSLVQSETNIFSRFSQKGYDKNDTDSDTGFRNLVTSRCYSFWQNQPTRFHLKSCFRQMTNLEKFIGFFRRRCCKMRNFGLKISVNIFPFYNFVFYLYQKTSRIKNPRIGSWGPTLIVQGILKVFGNELLPSSLIVLLIDVLTVRPPWYSTYRHRLWY